MNILWTSTCLAAVDDTYDRGYASDGESRFGAYLRPRVTGSGDEYALVTAEEFAAAVWHIGTSPVMSPGYVRLRPDVHHILPTWPDHYDGTLHFDVHIRLPHTTLPTGRDLSPMWQDWQPAPRSMDDDPYRVWWEPDRAGNALLTTTVIRLAVDDSWGLPTPTSRDRLTAEAKQSVAAVAAAVNRQAGPAVAALRGVNPC